VGRSHTLEHFANEAARDVTNPERKVSVQDRYRAALSAFGTAEEKQTAREKRDFAGGRVCSGSDFTVF
jgi:N-acetylated-alpha-linked acidic dipeptidase